MARTTEPLRAVLYSRVSTGKQAESGLGLDDQADTLAAAVEARGWVVARTAVDAGISGKSLRRRPALLEALGVLDRGEADVLVVAKLDRLSRSVADFAHLLDRARRKRWGVVVLDVEVDTTKASGEFVVNVLASAAQFERRLIGERVQAAHAQRRVRGQRPGQPPVLPQAVRLRIAKDHRRGDSLHAIARCLNDEAVPTARGGRWHASTVAHVLRSVALDAELQAVAG